MAMCPQEIWEGVYTIRTTGKYPMSLWTYHKALGPVVVGQPVDLMPVTLCAMKDKWFWRNKSKHRRQKAEAIRRIAVEIKSNGVGHAATLYVANLPKVKVPHAKEDRTDQEPDGVLLPPEWFDT